MKPVRPYIPDVQRINRAPWVKWRPFWTEPTKADALEQIHAAKRLHDEAMRRPAEVVVPWH